jgi:hypothetical protein
MTSAAAHTHIHEDESHFAELHAATKTGANPAMINKIQDAYGIARS